MLLQLLQKIKIVPPLIQCIRPSKPCSQAPRPRAAKRASPDDFQDQSHRQQLSSQRCPLSLDFRGERLIFGVFPWREPPLRPRLPIPAKWKFNKMLKDWPSRLDGSADSLKQSNLGIHPRVQSLRSSYTGLYPQIWSSYTGLYPQKPGIDCTRQP